VHICIFVCGVSDVCCGVWSVVCVVLCEWCGVVWCGVVCGVKWCEVRNGVWRGLACVWHVIGLMPACLYVCVVGVECEVHVVCVVV